jgi:hypothetical protein
LEGRRKGEREEIRIRKSTFDLERPSYFLPSSPSRVYPLQIEFIFPNQKHVNPIVEKIGG